MAIHLNLEEFDEAIRDLDVEVNFIPESGFPYLADKLAEVIEKNQAATLVACKLVKKMDLVRREMVAQRLLVLQTGSQAHKDAFTEAKEQMEILKSVHEVLKLHLDRLRKLPGDLRFYAKILEGALATTPGYGQVSGKRRVETLPSTLSTLGKGDERTIHEQTGLDLDVDGLFQ